MRAVSEADRFTADTAAKTGESKEGGMPIEKESPAASGKANGAGIEKQNRNHGAVDAADAQAPKARGKDFTRQQIGWTRQVRDDLRLPDLAVRIADALAFDYMNEEKGKAWPSEATLCKRVGKSPKTVNAVIDKLIERGHLIKFPGGGRGKSNRYSWIIKPENSGKNAGVLEEETPAFSKEFTDEKPRQKRAVNSGSFGAKTTAKMPEEPLEENRLIEPKGAARSRGPAPVRVGGSIKDDSSSIQNADAKVEISSGTDAHGGGGPGDPGRPLDAEDIENAKDAAQEWFGAEFQINAADYVGDLIDGFGPNANAAARDDAVAALAEALAGLPLRVAAERIDQHSRVALNLLHAIYGGGDDLRRDVDDMGRRVLQIIEQKGNRNVG